MAPGVRNSRQNYDLPLYEVSTEIPDNVGYFSYLIYKYPRIIIDFKRLILVNLLNDL